MQTISLEQFFSIYTLGLLLSISPGPANLTILAQVTGSGLKKGFFSYTCISTGLFFLVVGFSLLAVGVNQEVFQFVQTVSKVVGVIFLLYLSYVVLRSNKTSKNALCMGVISLLLIHPLNPKAWVNLSATSALANLQQPLFTEQLSASFGYLAGSMTAMFIWLVLAVPLTSLMQKKTSSLVLKVFFAGALIYAALKIALTLVS